MIKQNTNRLAFTLAEVLIVLGIIGVVAALTIPTLMKNYQKRVTLTQLQQTYSMLSQAVKMSTIDHGDITQWNIPTSSDYDSTDEFVTSYIMPYLKIIKKCDWTQRECEPTALYTMNGNASALSRNGVNYYMLSNGVVVYIWPCGSYIQIGVFSNGYQKRAIFGMNLFVIQVVKDNFTSSYLSGNVSKEGVYLYGEGYEWSFLVNPNNSRACAKSNVTFAGLYCGALIKLDGWQINYDF